MRKLFGILAACGALLAVSAAPAAANHTWGDYHWARTAAQQADVAGGGGGFNLRLDNNLTTPEWRAIGGEVSDNRVLDNPRRDWGDSSVIDTPLSGLLTDNKRCKATSGKVEVCNGKYGYNGWLGLASIWLSGSHITAGTTKVNDSYLANGTYTRDNKKHVLCQEVGHTFGLGHQSENREVNENSCMDYWKGLNNTTPDDHDYGLLEQIYAHTDSTTTLGSSSTTSARFKRVQRVSHDHPVDIGGVRHDIYIQDYGHGNKRIVFIHWKDRAAAERAPKDRIPE